ncbi:zincin [Nadsonia fulvescens var. elongata DSM 6958]|uniref:Zincin n=1 Tax=Nadsonia fulvescens var. elongata DSM 6958 TaxID=857566 RepID=A0A1E3PQT0_9ASCO|nr:zincin [Nadsonia fulvescens var. elongata DSM 6958]
MSAIPTAPQPAPRWDIAVDTLLVTVEDSIAQSKALEDRIAAIAPADRTFDSVIKPLADDDNISSGVINSLSFYQHVSTDAPLREASTKAEELINNFSIESGMREDVYNSVRSVQESIVNQSDLPWVKALSAEDRRLVQKMDNDYRRNGLALDLETRNRVKELRLKLSNLGIQFAKNLGEENSGIWFTATELDGVPEDILSSLKQEQQPITEGSEETVTRYFMTFKYPDLFPVLKYANNSQTRKSAFVGDQNKVATVNTPLLEEAVHIRSEIAQLMGYATHADFVLEERMAKKATNVWDFLNDLRTKLTPQAAREIQTLQELKNSDLKSRGLPADDRYYIWDNRYYDNLLLQNEYKVDSQKIAEYFPMQSTIDKMLSIFETVLELKFYQLSAEEAMVWHEDVKQFAVWKRSSNADANKNDEEFVGWLYMDLHPRDNKYGHAANFNLSPGFTADDGITRVYPVTALVCNFSKPTASKPSLLKHEEVTTFFHELGHGIHDLCGKTKYARFHGTSVARDFVEAPSQMLEYWTWSRDELKALSSHYTSGESIPDDLITSLIKSKHINGSLFNLRQLHFAIFDLTLHTISAPSKSEKPQDLKLDDRWNQLRREISLIEGDYPNVVTRGYSSFGHIMGGYDSAYYGYLWSQVFAADIYYTLFKGNEMSAEVGRRYRTEILEMGGARDENESLTILLGRAPENTSFLKEIGIEV